MATIGEIKAVLQPVIVALRRNAVNGRVENAKQVIAGSMTDTTGRRVRQCIEWLHDLGFLRIPFGKTFGYVDMSRMLQDSELNLVRVPRPKRTKPTVFMQEQKRLREATAQLEGEALVWAALHLTFRSEWVMSVEGQSFIFQIVGDAKKQSSSSVHKIQVWPALGIEESNGVFARWDGGKTQKLSVVALFVYHKEGQLRRAGRS